jgi:hypothetical protein
MSAAMARTTSGITRGRRDFGAAVSTLAKSLAMLALPLACSFRSYACSVHRATPSVVATDVVPLLDFEKLSHLSYKRN